MEENIITDEKDSIKYSGDFLDELVRLVFNKNNLNYGSDSFMTKDFNELQMNKVIPKKICTV